MFLRLCSDECFSVRLLKTTVVAFLAFCLSGSITRVFVCVFIYRREKAEEQVGRPATRFAVSAAAWQRWHCPKPDNLSHWHPRHHHLRCRNTHQKEHFQHYQYDGANKVMLMCVWGCTWTNDSVSLCGGVLEPSARRNSTSPYATGPSE